MIKERSQRRTSCLFVCELLDYFFVMTRAFRSAQMEAFGRLQKCLSKPLGVIISASKFSAKVVDRIEHESDRPTHHKKQ